VFRSALAYIHLSRPYNSLIPILLICVGALLSDADIVLTAITAVLTLFIHSGINILNDVEDLAIDKSNNNNSALHTDLIRPQSARSIGYILTLAPIAFAYFALPLTTLLLIVALYVLSTLYNSVLYLSRRPLASIITLGLCYGGIPYWIGLSLGSGADFTAIILGIFFALSRASLSILKDYKDASGDALHNKKTFLLVYGRTIVRRASVSLAVIGFIGIITCLMLLTSEPLYLPLIATLYAVVLVYKRLLLSPNKSYAQLNKLFHSLLRQQLLFDGLLVLWVSIS
jgi:4-hydroxybenzoate polyprenyltransferase